ncbi:ATP-binding cassette domain-containing protein, partial [uncultured Dubosiella sp.]
ICGLHHWIGSNGEKTFVENNGKNLSGGEKQRIALARALIKNPELLLIDEGLSGVHPDLRDEIVQHLVEYARQKSMAILTISHNHEFDDIANHTIVIQGERYETARA